MKKLMILLLITAILITALASCSNPDSSSNDDESTQEPSNKGSLSVGNDAMKLEQNNVQITPNMEAKPVIEALGDPLDYSESASCGFEDKDRTYKYNGFTIDTVVYNGVEYIYYVELTSDLISTPEGAAIGMTLEEIQEIYSGKYQMTQGHVVISFTNGSMRCFIKNGVCNSITYESTTLGNLEK